MKIDVVCDHQIHEAIAIVIAERRARGPAAVRDAGFRGHIGKRAVAIIVIENISTQAGDVEIGPAVVVIIAHRSAHGEAGRGQAGFFGDVGKRAVVIIVIERAARLLPFYRHLNGRSICEINIQPAVSIVVE